MRNILKHRDSKVLILLVLDIITVIASQLFTSLLKFDAFNSNQYSAESLYMLAYIVITIAVLTVFRLYNRVWTFASVMELEHIAAASVVIEVLFIITDILTGAGKPVTYYVINLLLMALCFFATRFSKRFADTVRRSYLRKDSDMRIMVVGAGSAATILIREITTQAQNAKVVCAIDDSKFKLHKYVLGTQIVGDRTYIKDAARKYDITEIIIAMPSVAPSELKKIIKICQETNLPVKILPAVSKSLHTSMMREVRPVNYEDLLGRDPIVVDQAGINEFINGKVVMVTGGGGSIGSELCRQIILNQPKMLIIFDIYENNAYSIQMELERKYPEADIKAIIGSVRDYDRMERIFQEYHPEIIYHAAAHKHVPLMEVSPNEAIKNNCLGTFNVCKLAAEYQTEKFVLISTDKAVRPTSIMGATKRLCEMIMQTFARKSEHTTFSAVRFGNVLGSNGSVIPLFLKQIENGGPVTVTHKDITRFFMTIPEAVSLVLQAGLYAKGGEIFVLDMGKPVKIYELAENLIRMKGYIPNENMMISIVGLRPGEKLYEELLMEEEGLEKSDNKLIFIGQPIKFDEDSFLDRLMDLIAESYRNGNHIKELTAELCEGYTITDN